MGLACRMDKATHTHTHMRARAHTIFNTYSFSTAAMVTRTRLNVTLFVDCLSCIVFVRIL